MEKEKCAGRLLGEDKGRDLADASMSQEMPIVGKSPEPGKGAWNGFSLTALRRDQLCPHLDLGLLASRTGTQ